MSQIAHRQRLRERRNATARVPHFTPAVPNRRFVQPGVTDFAATPTRPMAQTIQVAPPQPVYTPPGREPIAPAFNAPQDEGDGFDMHSLFDARLGGDPDENVEHDEPQGQPAHRDDLAKFVPPGTEQEEPAPEKDPAEQ